VTRADPGAGLDLVPGNTRLRARLAALGPPDPPGTAARTMPELTAALRALGCEVPTGIADRHPLRAALLAAVDARRDTQLRAAVAAYPGRARLLVQALLDEDDRADLVTLLRAAATGQAAPAVLPALRAVGRFDPPTLREIVSGDPEAVVPRLLAGRLPDPDTALALGHAWRRFELHQDLAELESSVAAAHAEATRRRVRAFGPAAAPVLRQLARRRDAVNLVTAVRLRAAGSAANGQFLPAGDLPLTALRAVAAGREAAAVVPAAWRAAVAAAELRGAEAAARAIDDAVDAAARNPVWRVDPLGAGVPVAYVAAVRQQARALRQLVVLTPDAGAVASEGRAA
jgi:vacuolar-type H+-ATPase subunit C/Vma6